MQAMPNMIADVIVFQLVEKLLSMQVLFKSLFTITKFINILRFSGSITRRQ